jgi:hypothetical protein
MSTSKKQLRKFLDYMNRNRRVGHTTAMLEGAKNVDAIVISHNYQGGQMLEERIEKEIPNLTKRSGKLKTLSIHETEQALLGYHSPIVFDNAALHILFSNAIHEIERLGRDKQSLEARLEKIKQAFNSGIVI